MFRRVEEPFPLPGTLFRPGAVYWLEPVWRDSPRVEVARLPGLWVLNRFALPERFGLEPAKWPETERLGARVELRSAGMPEREPSEPEPAESAVPPAQARLAFEPTSLLTRAEFAPELVALRPGEPFALSGREPPGRAQPLTRAAPARVAERNAPRSGSGCPTWGARWPDSRWKKSRR